MNKNLQKFKSSEKSEEVIIIGEDKSNDTNVSDENVEKTNDSGVKNQSLTKISYNKEESPKNKDDWNENDTEQKDVINQGNTHKKYSNNTKYVSKNVKPSITFEYTQQKKYTTTKKNNIHKDKVVHNKNVDFKVKQERKGNSFVEKLNVKKEEVQEKQVVVKKYSNVNEVNNTFNFVTLENGGKVKVGNPGDKTNFAQSSMMLRILPTGGIRTGGNFWVPKNTPASTVSIAFQTEEGALQSNINFVMLHGQRLIFKQMSEEHNKLYGDIVIVEYFRDFDRKIILMNVKRYYVKKDNITGIKSVYVHNTSHHYVVENCVFIPGYTQDVVVYLNIMNFRLFSGCKDMLKYPDEMEVKCGFCDEFIPVVSLDEHCDMFDKNNLDKYPYGLTWLKVINGSEVVNEKDPFEECFKLDKSKKGDNDIKDLVCIIISFDSKSIDRLNSRHIYEGNFN